MQHKLDAAGNAQFFINPEEIVAYGVLTQSHFLGDLSVTQSFGYEIDDLFFALRQQVASLSVCDTQRRCAYESIHNQVKLMTIGPNLPSVHGANTAAESS